MKLMNSQIGVSDLLKPSDSMKMLGLQMMTNLKL